MRGCGEAGATRWEGGRRRQAAVGMAAGGGLSGCAEGGDRVGEIRG